MSEQDTQQQLQRLQKTRTKIEEVQREKSRMTGELAVLQNQSSEYEKKSTEDFGCDISSLPNFVKQLKEESETALYNAEVILGMREGIIKQSPVASSEPASQPVAETVQKEEVDSDILV